MISLDFLHNLGVNIKLPQKSKMKVFYYGIIFLIYRRLLKRGLVRIISDSWSYTVIKLV